MNEKEKNDLMFLQLIMTFESAAWIQMGKVKNPQTDKIERSLIQAQYSIDMLDMLKAKTANNLSEQELKMLSSTLTNLKMNYVEEAEKEQKEKAAGKTTAAEKKETEKADKKEPAAGEQK